MAAFRNTQFTCSCCGRECKFKDMKKGICRECLADDPDEVAPEVFEELRSPAEDHDRAYNGTELDEVDYDDVSFD
jgi:hypothetical protein